MIGGTSLTEATGLAVDAGGRAYVVGRTESVDFPTTADAFQRALGGSSDAFALAVNASGTALIIPRASLSLNKPATASSVESAELAAGNAVDGNLTTAWSSEPSDPQWITVDLGSSIAIERVWSRWGSAYLMAQRLLRPRRSPSRPMRPTATTAFAPWSSG